MELAFSPSEEIFRQEVRAWLLENAPSNAMPSGDTREGFEAHIDWERRLFDARLAVVSWPEEFGGRDHTTVIHAVEKIKGLLTERHTVFDQVNELMGRIRLGTGG